MCRCSPRAPVAQFPRRGSHSSAIARGLRGGVGLLRSSDRDFDLLEAFLRDVVRVFGYWPVWQILEPVIHLFDECSAHTRNMGLTRREQRGPCLYSFRCFAFNLGLGNNPLGSGEIRNIRILGGVALSAALAGCVTSNETVQFRTSSPQQQAMMVTGSLPLSRVRRLHSFLFDPRPGN
jgi:hypothetical protein